VAEVAPQPVEGRPEFLDVPQSAPNVGGRTRPDTTQIAALRLAVMTGA
jgi:hypothetical protein